MLVNNATQTELKSGEVYGFKLTTGEEIITKVTVVKDKTVSVSAPHYLTQTSEGVAFAPALVMMASDNDPVLRLPNVVFYFVPDQQFISAYEQAMSDIILPDSNIVT